ncbi:unnamed protein product [Symbiodinium natans]|uniref:Uncharacterized protein n=1 Tax=Symbiodinium natans TaxID=878477 RepID=A0A812JBI2_9DINO|nr:unnamed protein product [Symbiodinium natans]
MHEEQNKVALRSFALCAFYQAGCFEMLQPLIMMTLEKIGSKEDRKMGPRGFYKVQIASSRRYLKSCCLGLAELAQNVDGMRPTSQKSSPLDKPSVPSPLGARPLVHPVQMLRCLLPRRDDVFLSPQFFHVRTSSDIPADLTCSLLQQLHDLAAGTALSAVYSSALQALSYFEKVTSTRRFANAYLRDEAMLSKDGDQEMRGLSGLVALFLHESPPSLSKRRVGCSAPRM